MDQDILQLPCFSMRDPYASLLQGPKLLALHGQVVRPTAYADTCRLHGVKTVETRNHPMLRGVVGRFLRELMLVC